MMKMTTAACAFALGVAWVASPAIAQETTKDKAERKADQIEQKADQKADDIKTKADQKADKVRANAEGKSDTMGNKAERAWDKTKAKTREMKDSVKDTVKGNSRPSADVRSAQQALKGRGFDPGPTDGVMGPRTTAAVRDFQQKENLTVTGQLDAETHSRLLASAPPAASPATEPKETNPKRQSQ
jgi:peptidoglycan hydrolase-like protein with peptidoglycan-binding domain